MVWHSFIRKDVILQSEVKTPAPINKTKSVLAFICGLSATVGFNRCMSQFSQDLEVCCYNLLVHMQTKTVLGYSGGKHI